MIAEGKLPPEMAQSAEEAIEEEIRMLQRFAEYSPEEQARREYDAMLWREVTGDIVSTANLDAVRDKQFESWRRRQ